MRSRSSAPDNAAIEVEREYKEFVAGLDSIKEKQRRLTEEYRKKLERHKLLWPEEYRE
ncbi:MAG: hypothetical protein AAB495_04695 [Patescibacteria group bacterium]